MLNWLNCSKWAHLVESLLFWPSCFNNLICKTELDASRTLTSSRPVVCSNKPLSCRTLQRANYPLILRLNLAVLKKVLPSRQPRLLLKSQMLACLRRNQSLRSKTTKRKWRGVSVTPLKSRSWIPLCCLKWKLSMLRDKSRIWAKKRKKSQVAKRTVNSSQC